MNAYAMLQGQRGDYLRWVAYIDGEAIAEETPPYPLDRDAREAWLAAVVENWKAEHEEEA